MLVDVKGAFIGEKCPPLAESTLPLGSSLGHNKQRQREMSDLHHAKDTT